MKFDNFLSTFAVVFVGLCISCHQQNTKILEHFPDGTAAAEAFYKNPHDTSSYKIQLYYPNGKVYKEAYVAQNKYVNRKLTYDEHGRITQIDSLSMPCEMSISRCDGVVIRYSQNGLVSEKHEVRNNHYNGWYQSFRPDGRLGKEYQLKDDSIKDGMSRDYYPDGSLAILQTFKNDSLEGMAYYFLPNGDTVKYVSYEHGDVGLPYKTWFDHDFSVYGNYINSHSKNVKWTWYKKNELLRSKIVKPGKGGFIVPGKND